MSKQTELEDAYREMIKSSLSENVDLSPINPKETEEGPSPYFVVGYSEKTVFYVDHNEDGSYEYHDLANGGARDIFGLLRIIIQLYNAGAFDVEWIHRSSDEYAEGIFQDVVDEIKKQYF